MLSTSIELPDGSVAELFPANRQCRLATGIRAVDQFGDETLFDSSGFEKRLSGAFAGQSAP